MSDYRINFIKSLETNLSNILPNDKLHLTIDMVTKLLNKYEITERCTELIPVDSVNEKLIKRYCACLLIDGKSDKTIYQYKKTISKLSRVLQKSFIEMGAYDIRYYLACEKEHMSNRTLENTRAYISAFFQWLLDENIINKNPMDVIKPIKYIDEIRKPFSETEIDSLRVACKNDRERTLVEVLLSSGVRVSELSEMKVEDINTSSYEVHVKHGKGGKERVTYISSVAAVYLKKYLSGRKETGDYLFYNQHHEKLNSGGIRFILRMLSKRSGVDDVHPHRFRRTFATGLTNRGMDIQEVQRLLGHSNINTTLKYVCLSDERVRASYRKYIA